MKNWAKILSILGISFLGFIFDIGAGFVLLVLLIYFEFINKKQRM